MIDPSDNPRCAHRFLPPDDEIMLSETDLANYHRDGFLIVSGLLGTEEIGLLREIARADRELAASASGRSDGEGGSVRLVVRNDLPTDSIYGAIVRSKSIVTRMQHLIGGDEPTEVYHWHHKMILKEPLVGGAWAWHQDYGYWYNDGCLFPRLASCMIAVDRATEENGCLRVLRGSHHLGRIEHGKVGENTTESSQQTGADPERVRAAEEKLETVSCELEPGSAIFFHANTLHRSDQNRSENPRWAFICCYNAADNEPYKPSKHPSYTPLDIWPDGQIAEVGRAHRDQLAGV